MHSKNLKLKYTRSYVYLIHPNPNPNILSYSLINSGLLGTHYICQCVKKHLKIPKGQSKAVKSKKDRQWNDQMEIDKNRNKDLQNTTQKTNDWATRNLLKAGMNSGVRKKEFQDPIGKSRKQAKLLLLKKIYIATHYLGLELFHLFLELIVAGLDWFHGPKFPLLDRLKNYDYWC